MAECTDIDECDMEIRFCGKLQCENTVGTYTCGCRDGFETVRDGNTTACVDIDECLNEYSCPGIASCQNSFGKFTCHCPTGYSGDTCVDVDECSNETETMKCDQNAECTNTEGSYHCDCNEGFYGSGVNCDPGQCTDSSCPANSQCISQTSTKCECKKNFIQVNGSCEDVDECQGENFCDTFENVECINLPGSYNCQCSAGYFGNGAECREGNCTDEICPANEKCVSPTSSACQCREGFVRDESQVCIDIDECSTV